MIGPAPRFLVRFPAPASARDTVGVGFVVGPEHILTCAHVINAALGRDLLQQDRPTELVTLRLPMCGDAIREARVEIWLPPPASGVTGEDIAGLMLVGEPLPADLQPARLSQEVPADNPVRVFGYPEGALRPAGAWASCQLQGEVGHGLLQLDSDPAAAWRAQPGYSGAPVLDRADAVLGMFKAASRDDRDGDGYAIGSATLCAAWDEVLDIPPPCPYKRLVAFDEQDHDVFVGREEDVARLEKAVQRSPLVLVVGPSGVGKSSLVQAGLLPTLRRAGGWTMSRCRPGSMPFHELAAALFRAEGATPGAEAVQQRASDIRAGGLVELVSTIHIAQGQRVLVVVDQLEELFTTVPEAQVVEEFLETILSLLTAQQSATIVATVRAGFADRLLAHPDAAPRLDGRFVPLSPLGADALHRVVCEPAERRGVTFASSLVDRIVRDARTEAGALPLLQFTLSELWPRQRRRVLTHEAYEEIGGLEGSLRAHAEAAIATLIENRTSESTLRGALLALISRTGDRAPVTRRICPIGELSAEQQAVIDALARTRLVTTDTDRTGRRIAELAHEFLLYAWPRLADLAEADAAFVRWRGEVEQWRAVRDDLLPEPMIAEARRWCDERPEETESIRNLVERSEAAQRRRVCELEEAWEAARTAARYADARRLAAQAELAGRRPAGLTATLSLAAASLRSAPTFEGDAVARWALGVAALPVSHLAHKGPVCAVAFSPDGARVATASEDGTARVFDTASGAELAAVSHSDTVCAVAFSPDGLRVATASDDRTARVFDAISGAELARLSHAGPVCAVAFSPEGSRLATASTDCTVRLFDLARRAELTRLRHNGPVCAVAFSPDGTRVATASKDRTARVFNAVSGVEQARLTHHGPVWSVAFNPAGTLVVSASDDGTARVFHAVSGVEQARLTHHGPVWSVAFNPDGTRVATASTDHTARVFDAASSAEYSRLTHDSTVWSAVFSPDGIQVATASDDCTARVFDTTSGAEHSRLIHDGVVWSVHWSPDGSRMASASSDGTARVFDVITGVEQLRITHKDSVRRVAFSPDGTQVASASTDGTVLVCDVVRGFVQTRVIHAGPVWSVALSPDGTRVASASADGTVLVCDVVGGFVQTRVIHGGPVWLVAFSPDGTRVASASADGSARVFDATSGTEQARVAHGGTVWSVAFSPDGTRVATASTDRTARVFNAASGMEQARLTHEDTVLSVRFSLDGSRVFTASKDGTARVFDAASGIEQARLTHDDTVWSVALSPDGLRVATASSDNTARVFDAASGTEHLRLHIGGPVRSVAFSPDGTSVATASDDGTARVLPVDVDALLDAVDRRILRPLTETEWNRYGGRPIAQDDAKNFAQYRTHR